MNLIIYPAIQCIANPDEAISYPDFFPMIALLFRLLWQMPEPGRYHLSHAFPHNTRT